MIKNILKHRLVSVLSLVALLFVLGGFFWTYFSLKTMGGGPFILHFDDIQGITQVGGLGTLLFIGILGIVVTVFNLFLALELEERDMFLGKITAVVTLAFGILLFMAFAAILSVN